MGEESRQPLSASKALTAFVSAIALGLVILVGVRWYAYQWDFHMFLWSARDFAAGTSPYKGAGLSYYHPPVMLYLYRLFTFLPEGLACTLWYGLKLLALTGLVVIWHKHFVRLRYSAATIAFMVLAYNAAIYSDLVAGNVSIFEQLLLWLGFSQLLRGRYWVLCACLVVAAQVKLTPIYFAVLLLTVVDKPRWGWFFATLAGFVLVFSLNHWLQPDLFAQFWQVSSKLDERGVDSSSALALFRDIIDSVGLTTSSASKLDEVLYLGTVATVGLVSLKRLLHYRKVAAVVDQRLLICFACLIFALISPRFKVYSYILLVPPTLYLLPLLDMRRHIPLLTALIAALVLFPHAKSLLPVRLMFQLFTTYMPLFAAALVWAGYVKVLKDALPQSDAEAASDAELDGSLRQGAA